MPAVVKPDVISGSAITVMGAFGFFAPTLQEAEGYPTEKMRHDIALAILFILSVNGLTALNTERWEGFFASIGVIVFFVILYERRNGGLL